MSVGGLGKSRIVAVDLLLHLCSGIIIIIIIIIVSLSTRPGPSSTCRPGR